MQAETKEFVWSAKLSKEQKSLKWEGRNDGALEQIVLKLAILGSGAKEGERNLVEVTTFNSEQKKFKTCICALSVGKTENQPLADLSLFPPANFTLAEGNGPVHIVANHIILDDDLSDEDDDDDEEIEDLRQKLNAKSGKGDAPAKAQKAGDEDDESDDDDDEDLFDDDDDEEEEEMEIPQKKNKKEAKGKKTQIPVEMEGDSDEDDDLGDESDDEAEEEEEAPVKKRKLTNGKAAEKKPSLTSPERKQKAAPVEQKTPKTDKETKPKTPKSEKKTPHKVQYTSVDEIKDAIKKYPGGKPRKEDKFCNWVKNTFRVSDSSWTGELWKWHKKEMGL